MWVRLRLNFYGLHVSKEITFDSFKAIALFHNHPKSDEIFLFHFSVRNTFLQNALFSKSRPLAGAAANSFKSVIKAFAEPIIKQQ